VTAQTGDELEQRVVARSLHRRARFGQGDEAEITREPGAGHLPEVAKRIARRGRAALRRIDDVLASIVVHGVDGELGRDRRIETERSHQILEEPHQVVGLERRRHVRHGTGAPRVELTDYLTLSNAPRHAQGRAAGRAGAGRSTSGRGASAASDSSVPMTRRNRTTVASASSGPS